MSERLTAQGCDKVTVHAALAAQAPHINACTYRAAQLPGLAPNETDTSASALSGIINGDEGEWSTSGRVSSDSRAHKIA